MREKDTKALERLLVPRIKMDGSLWVPELHKKEKNLTLIAGIPFVEKTLSGGKLVVPQES